jgi:heterodisulfide reductase subunit A
MGRVGVFICHCGVNIAATVNVEEVTDYAKKLDDVVVSKDFKYMCSDRGAQLIKDEIKKHKLDSVVIASCSPRMHETTFRRVVEDGGLNPYSMEIANIREQCSWVHEDRKEATEKAKTLIKAAVAKSRWLEPLQSTYVPIIPKAIVIGGGIAGIQASLDLADAGFNVSLVERTSSIGGRMAQLDKTYPTLDCSSCILTPKMMDVQNHQNIELLTYSEVTEVSGSIGNYKVTITKHPRYVDEDKCTACSDCASVCRLKDRLDNEFEMKLGKRGAVYLPFPQAIPLKYTIDAEHCLFLTRGKCGESPPCIEACVRKAIDFTQKPETIERDVGAILVTTGYDLMDPSALYEYGYLKSADVITSLELERLISSAGPTSGEILRPSNGENPKSITFILCVGSRDQTAHEHCCRVGCMSSLKHVYLLREKLGEDVEINICYTDIRSFGKGYEEFYRKIRGKHANFFRGRPSEVRPQDNALTLDIFDTTTNKLFEVKTDLVVLVPALEPSATAGDLSRILRISQSPDDFFLEAHPKLRPVDTFTNGIYIAGCAQGPKDITDAVSQASGAAARAMTILSKKELETEPIIAQSNEDLCSGCGVCISICPYKAIELIKDEKGTHSHVNEALCKGCGACCNACPAGAMQQCGFKDKQILPMIDEST